jgi:hypothetical protein
MAQAPVKLLLQLGAPRINSSVEFAFRFFGGSVDAAALNLLACVKTCCEEHKLTAYLMLMRHVAVHLLPRCVL